jgi:HSP20 family protein
MEVVMKHLSTFSLLENRDMYHPSRFLASLQHEVNRLFDASFMSTTPFTPLMEVTEDKDKYTMRVELAGIPKENVTLEVRYPMLTLSGKKETQTSHDEKGTTYTECSYGEFRRTITLPEDVKDDEISAEMENGILKITLQKKEGVPSSTTRVISIKGQ